MKIRSIEAIPFSIPLRRSTEFAHGSLQSADHVLVRVHTDAGLVSHAEAPARPFTYGESQQSIVAAIDQWFAPALAGLDPLDREIARDRMSWLAGNQTCHGAVDIAMWDLIGLALGQPVHRLLGGFANSMDVAHILFSAAAEEMVSEALEVTDRYGITAFKIKTGKDVTQDAYAVTLLREKLGDQVQLYVDANRGWTADHAVALLPVLVEAGITMVEEPSPSGQPMGRRRLATMSSIPIVGDESVTRLGEVATQILAGHLHAVSVKTARTGFTESQRILGLCEGLGIGTVVGSQLDGMVGTLGSLSFGAAYSATARRPAELDYFLEFTDDIVAEPLTIQDGRVQVPCAPGVGIVIDEDKLNHYRVDR
jgi:L-alanine-DL-glutamate epimerase-like enolase superfamily enzyme